MTMKKLRPRYIAGIVCFVLIQAAFAADPAPKNIILMVSDGQGFNAVRATEYYTGRKGVYEGFPHRYAVQTVPAGSRNGQAGKAYDPPAMAGDFKYALNGPTDSAAAATALFSGVKVYNGEINYTPDGKSLETFFEKAARAGKSIGAVSSIQWTHATPAAVFAHNKSRLNYGAMAREAIYGGNPNAANAGYDARNYSGRLKVVMGPGNPFYDDDARERSPAVFGSIGEESHWKDLEQGVNGWKLITAKTEFEALTQGSTPDKVFGIPHAAETLQFKRSGAGAPNNKTLPWSTPLNAGIPDLATMARGALNVLDNNNEGFALMIEGGAVDSASHYNQIGRMIEEESDFNAAVAAVVAYLDDNTSGNNWSNTLLIVTADHETGYLWGDGRVEGSTYFDVNGNGAFDHGVDYAHVKDNGPGNLPDAWYHSLNHSNSLVPLFARGPHSDLFNGCVIGEEPNLRKIYNLDESWTGRYIDNTCVFQVMERGLSDTAP